MAKREGMWTGLALAAILLAGAYARLPEGDLGWFVFDQARDAYTASAIASGQSLPLLGPEVQGGPGHTWGPLYFYILAIPFSFSGDPAVALVFVSAIGLASVFLTYRLGRAFFSVEVGLIAAALFATYPLPVIESRAISNIGLLSFFTVLFFHSLLSLLVHRRSAMIVPVLLCVGALVQIHLAAVSCFAILAVALACFRPRIRLIHLAAALAGLFLLLSPYLTAQVRDGFRDVTALLSYAQGQFRPRAPGQLGLLAAQFFFTSPDVVAGFRDLIPGWRADVFQFLHMAEAGLLALGAAWVVGVVLVRWLRRPQECAFAAHALLALWLAVPFVIVGAGASIRLYHFDVIYPAPFLAGGIVLSRLGGALAGRMASARRPLIAACVAAFVAATVLSQLDFHHRFRQAIRAAGAIRWSDGGSQPPYELIPITYHASLVRALVKDMGADRQGVFRRTHGSRFQSLSEDKGYFFDWTVAGSRKDRAPSPTSHYALIRDEHLGEAVRGRRTAIVGPYTIVEYVPFVDYSSWRCAHDIGPNWSGPGAPEDRGSWPLSFPTTEPPNQATYGAARFREWEAATVYCRGELVLDQPRPLGASLVISQRMSGVQPAKIVELYVNGTPAPLLRSVAHATLTIVYRDAIFDVGGQLQPGRNVVAFRVAGPGRAFDLDVYEIIR